MNSTPASQARLRVGIADRKLRPWLAALALGLAALGFLMLAPARTGIASPGASFPPAIAMMAAYQAPVQAPRIHRLDREGTAIAADVEAYADPAMPGAPDEVEQARAFVAEPFAEKAAAMPNPAPVSSPLRPPRLA